MARRSSIFTCTAPAGTGKSLCRGPLFLIREFLPEGAGVWRGNIPIDVERLAEFYCKLDRKADPEEIVDRVRPIPPDVCLDWQRDIKEGGTGPWDTYRGVDLTGGHFCFDEAHLFLGRRHSTQHRDAWRKWLAEVRHVGATVEFVSQDLSSFAEDVEQVAESRVILTNFDLELDPLFKIRVGDWYELRAAFTREYKSAVRQDEQIKKAGRWTTIRTVYWPNEPQYWALYDSYSKPQGHAGQVGDGKAAAAHEFERRSIPGVCWWFARRNAWELGNRAAIAAGALVFCCGGGAWAFRAMMDAATAARFANSPASPRENAERAIAEVMREKRAGAGEPGEATTQVEPLPVVDLEQYERDSVRLAELEAWAARVTEPESTLGVIMPESFTFRDGATYKIGDRIRSGANEGYVVTNIDFESRTVYAAKGGLGGDVVSLVLRRDGLPPPAADVDDWGGEPEFRRGVPRGQNDLQPGGPVPRRSGAGTGYDLGG